MRISDWSSDVCSSDLHAPAASFGRYGRGDEARFRLAARGGGGAQRPDDRGDTPRGARAGRSELARRSVRGTLATALPGSRPALSRRRHCGPHDARDRKSVGYGTRVSGRVELGGRPTIKKKNQTSK